MRRISLVLVLLVTMACTVHSERPVILMNSDFDYLSGKLDVGLRMLSLDYRDLFDDVELIPVYEHLINQRLYLMLTQNHALDLVIDEAVNMRGYAEALLVNWGSYEELKDELSHLKDFLLIVEGDVHGAIIGSRRLPSGSVDYAVGTLKKHTSSRETIQAFMEKVYGGLQPPRQNDILEVRRAAERFFEAFFIHKDFGTAFLYVHPSRTLAEGPLSWTQETFRQYGAWNYYSNLQPYRFMVVETRPLPSWRNPYDGIEYTRLYEVRTVLLQKTSFRDVDNYFTSVWQNIDGEWYVFLSRYGFEQGLGRKTEAELWD